MHLISTGGESALLVFSFLPDELLDDIVVNPYQIFEKQAYVTRAIEAFQRELAVLEALGEETFVGLEQSNYLCRVHRNSSA